jgi:hypothetical protein
MSHLPPELLKYAASHSAVILLLLLLLLPGTMSHMPPELLRYGRMSTAVSVRGAAACRKPGIRRAACSSFCLAQ